MLFSSLTFVLPFLTILLHILGPVSSCWLLILFHLWFLLPPRLIVGDQASCLTRPHPVFHLSCSHLFPFSCLVLCTASGSLAPFPARSARSLLFWALVPVCSFTSFGSGTHPCWAPDARLPLPPCHVQCRKNNGLHPLLSSPGPGPTPEPGPAPVWAAMEIERRLGLLCSQSGVCSPAPWGDVGLPLGKHVKLEHAPQGKTPERYELLFRGHCLPWVSCLLQSDMGIKAAFHV